MERKFHGQYVRKFGYTSRACPLFGMQIFAAVVLWIMFLLLWSIKSHGVDISVFCLLLYLKFKVIEKFQANKVVRFVVVHTGNRDLKHRRRRAHKTTTGSKISPYRTTVHARLVVLVQFRTSKRQVCRPERT